MRLLLLFLMCAGLVLSAATGEVPEPTDNVELVDDTVDEDESASTLIAGANTDDHNASRALCERAPAAPKQRDHEGPNPRPPRV